MQSHTHLADPQTHQLMFVLGKFAFIQIRYQLMCRRASCDLQVSRIPYKPLLCVPKLVFGWLLASLLVLLPRIIQTFNLKAFR